MRDTQGLTYCRPDMRPMPLLQKISDKHCLICRLRMRGSNHIKGRHHRLCVPVKDGGLM